MANTYTITQAMLPNGDTVKFKDSDAVRVVTGKGLSTEDYTTAEKEKLADIALPIPIAQGGTGATDSINAFKSLAFLGVNPTGGAANDTQAFWKAKGTGYAYIGSNDQLNGQPGVYGFLINIVYLNEIYQEFIPSYSYIKYARKAGSATTNMPSWTSIGEALSVNCGTLSSLPTTINNTAITADMVVLKADLSNPSAQAANDWQAVCVNGAVTISGTISGTTTLTLYLMKSRT